MEKLNFEININASKEKVWQILWNDETYRQWTNAFCEGSYAVTDWKQGSKVHFLSPSGAGMYSVIDKVCDNEFMSFKHLGELKDKIEQPITEETQKWSGCFENYTLTENDGITTLLVEADAMEQYTMYFNEKFPIALEIVKNLAETKANAA